MAKHTNLEAPQKGLFMDAPKNVQPEGTYSYALNATSVSSIGEEGVITNECGNDPKFSIAASYNILGHRSLPNGDTVLVSVVRPDGLSFGIEYLEIGIHKATGDYVQKLRSKDFSFSKYYQVQIEVSMQDGCDTIIYFNTPSLYAVNIDSLEQYLLAGETITSANTSGEGWDIGLLKLFSEYSNAYIEEIEVNDTGGDLPLGTYFVTIQYLDSALNGTGWMDFTNAIPIVDDSLSSSFETIDGGLNSTSPASSKSITLSITDLDISYPYYQIGLIASNDDVRTGYLFPEINLTSNNSSYVISSIGGVEQVPLTSLTVERAVYSTAQTLTQKDSRLLLGNINEKEIDHALFQQTVNGFKTNWYTKQFNAIDLSSQTSYKSPEAFFEFRGHPRDEVVALGVRFRFKDGYITPVYHIPGRELNTGVFDPTLPENLEPNSHNRPVPIDGWDTSLYTVTLSTSPGATEVYIGNVDFLGFTDANYTTFDCGDGAGVVARWRFCNTAIMYTTGLVDEDNYAEGEMAYWESTLTYPESLDCDGVRVFPEGVIRHHKLPDATLIAHANKVDDIEYIYPIGIRVSEISIPTGYLNDIDGIQIVRIKRDDTNSSVLDAGIFTRINRYDDGAGTVFINQPGVNNGFFESSSAIEGENYAHGIHTPKLKFFKNRLPASYIKYDHVLNGNVDYNLSDTGASPERYASLLELSYLHRPYGDLSLTRGILNKAYIDADSWLNGVLDLGGTVYDFNNTEQQEVYVTTFSHRGTGPYAGLQTDTDADVTQYYSGMTSPNYDAMFYYGSLKRHIPQQYGNIGSGIYIPLTAAFQEVTSSVADFGGDVFISKLYTRRTFLHDAGKPVNHDETIDAIYRNVIGFYCESQINCGYRHTGEEAYETYYPKETLFTVQMIERYTSDDPTDITNEYLDLIPNHYAINKDYLQENSWRVFLPLSDTFDYCNNCSGEYKVRIAYSEIKATEGSADSFKLFLSNNYRDIPADRGEITNLFVLDDKLYAHTEGALFMIPTSPQQFTASETTLYIGTGEFLAIPPINTKSIKEGYLGSVQKFATITSEHGTFFVSRDRIFLLSTEGLNEISKAGLRNFFMDNTIKYGIDVYNITGETFTETCNTTSGSLPGYIAAYDAKKHRLVLHKKDARILEALEELYAGLKVDGGDYEVGTILYDPEYQIFQKVLTKTVLPSRTIYTYDTLSFDDAEYFRDCSYTISYDLQNKHWVSFHSYLPNYMYNTAYKMYSYLNSASDVYEHDSLTYQRFYGIYKNHIVEFTVTDTPLLANVAKSVGYISKTRQYDTTTLQHKIIKDRTYTDVWLYNDSQSSGKLGITIPSSPYNPADYITYSPTLIRVENKEGVWKFNQFKNYVPATNAVPIATSAWDSISSEYPIDKIPNPSSLDLTKSQYDLDKFRDMYVSIRLYNTFQVQPQLNYELITQYLYTNAKYSNR